MKQSVFNTRLPLSKNTDIIFNALTQCSIIVKKGKSIEFTDNENPIISHLIERGMVCDESIDERTLVRGLYLDNVENTDCFRLTINPTLNCNFRCWYCYENHSNKTRMTKETVDKTKRFINMILERHNSIELAFFGGEPLMEFKTIVIPLAEYTRDLCESMGKKYSISFTSNGFLINDSIISELRRFNLGYTQITLDGGPESHNKTRVSRSINSFETIVKNIKKLAKAGFPVLLRINVTKEIIRGAMDIPLFFKSLDSSEKRNISVLVQQVWQDVGNDIFDETWDLYESFLKIGIHPWPRYFDSIKSICYADKRSSAVVNYDGRVFKCTAVDFDTKKEDAELSDDIFTKMDVEFERRLTQRFNNEPCMKCRILPVCNGGCSKNIDQANGASQFCLYPTEEDKDKYVKKIIKEHLAMHHLGIR